MTRLNFHILLIALASFFISSCGSGDDDITGSYKITSYGITNCDDPEENITLDVSSDDGCSTLFGTEFCGSGNFTLNADNTFSVSFTFSGGGFSDSTTGSGEYTVAGNTITICDMDECLNGTINGNTLTLSIPTEEDGCIITMTGEKQ